MSEEFLIGRPSRRQLCQGGLAAAAGPLLGGMPSLSVRPMPRW